MKLNEMYVLTYSVGQGCCNIETWDSMIRSNHQCALNNKNSGYMTMGIFDTHEEAHEAGKALLASIKSEKQIPIE